MFFIDRMNQDELTNVMKRIEIGGKHQRLIKNLYWIRKQVASVRIDGAHLIDILVHGAHLDKWHDVCTWNRQLQRMEDVRRK